MANQLKMGALLSYINIIINVIIGLLYTPVMIRLLGQAEYGLYSLIGALIGYLSILDMGLGNTIVRYIAKNRAISDKKSENELNGLFFGLYCIIGLITICVGSILYYNLGNMFQFTLNLEELNRAKFMTILLIFNFSISFPLGIFASLIQAYERFIFLRVCNILRIGLNPLITLPLLYLGYGSIMLVIIATILNIAFLLLNVYYCFKYLNIKFSIKRFEKNFLWEIIVYSFFIFLNVITDKIYWGTGQFILGIVAGTKEVAVYAIAMQFILMYMGISTAISGVFLPKITMMVANNSRLDELSSIMVKIGRIQFFILGYIFLIFILVGHKFIYLWAGEAYLDAYIIISILMFSIMIPLSQNIGIAILQAQNRNKFRMIVYVLLASINVGVSYYLAHYYGGIGCAITTMGAQLIGNVVIINFYYHYKIKLDVGLFFRDIMKIFASLIWVGIIGFCVGEFMQGYTWIDLIKQSAIITIIYVFWVFYFNINTYEKNLLYNLGSKLKFFRRRRIWSFLP